MLTPKFGKNKTLNSSYQEIYFCKEPVLAFFFHLFN
ncbi:hypothetical protein PRO82_002261 [Candidatus Protochlamydia amoebophila]|nr:hypothetical protein [Candidatus Protochlamydia amoebophila]